jgi:hypothetical protein
MVSPGRNWLQTAEGLPAAQNGVAQGTRQGQCDTIRKGQTDVREKASGATGMQQWHEGPRRNPAATSEEGDDNRQRHQKAELKTASTSGKQNDTQQDLQGDPRAEDREASSRDFQWVTKNE